MKKITVADVEPLIAKNNGNVAAIARALGVARSTVLRRVEESPKLVKALEDARQSMVDNAESSLYRAVLDGNITAIIFFLKTRGKDRGYVERQEVTGRDGGPFEYVNESELDREIRSLLREMAAREKGAAARSPADAAGEVGVDTAHADGQAEPVPGADL